MTDKKLKDLENLEQTKQIIALLKKEKTRVESSIEIPDCHPYRNKAKRKILIYLHIGW